jgi:hypothetical protein
MCHESQSSDRCSSSHLKLGSSRSQSRFSQPCFNNAMHAQEKRTTAAPKRVKLLSIVRNKTEAPLKSNKINNNSLAYSSLHYYNGARGHSAEGCHWAEQEEESKRRPGGLDGAVQIPQDPLEAFNHGAQAAAWGHGADEQDSCGGACEPILCVDALMPCFQLTHSVHCFILN